MKGRNLLFKASSLAIVSTVTIGNVQSAAYEAGKFTFKPLNANITSYAPGFVKKDSRFRGIALNTLTLASAPYDRDVNVFKSPSNWGFAEADRNATGYGIEFGYVLGADIEIFGRAGFSIENGLKNIVQAGDQVYKFKDRKNLGLSLGIRKYFDYQSSWKPFVSAAVGVVSQGNTNADVFTKNPDSNNPSAQNPLARYRILNKKNLLNVELSAGTDYVFTPNVAMSMSISARYISSAGTKATSFAGINGTSNGNPVAIPARTTLYTDNKSNWTFPFIISLKFIL